jgi:hypothetical protein
VLRVVKVSLSRVKVSIIDITGMAHLMENRNKIYANLKKMKGACFDRANKLMCPYHLSVIITH